MAEEKAAMGQSNGTLPPFTGPHPGIIKVSRTKFFEHEIQQLQNSPGFDKVKEDNYRIHGVNYIDSIRKAFAM